MSLKIISLNPGGVPVDLLLEADPSLESIHAYKDKCTWLAATDSDEIIGVCGYLKTSDSEVEIMNLAVREEKRNAVQR